MFECGERPRHNVFHVHHRQPHQAPQAREESALEHAAQLQELALIAARPVDHARPYDDRRHAAAFPRRMYNCLGIELRHLIRRQRRARCVLVDVALPRAAESRSAAEVDESPDGLVHARHQHILCAFHIDALHLLFFFVRYSRHAAVRGEMKNRVSAVSDSAQSGRIGNVARPQLSAHRLEPGRLPGVSNQAPALPAFAQESCCEVPADKACGSGNQCLHNSSTRLASSSMLFTRLLQENFAGILSRCTAIWSARRFVKKSTAADDIARGLSFSTR